MFLIKVAWKSDTNLIPIKVYQTGRCQDKFSWGCLVHMMKQHLRLICPSDLDTSWLGASVPPFMRLVFCNSINKLYIIYTLLVEKSTIIFNHVLEVEKTWDNIMGRFVKFDLTLLDKFADSAMRKSWKN